MISDYLKTLKTKKNITNQELSDLSGVPVGTINRIMANQTENPSFQTVCDIVMALDGSLDELAGIKTRTAERAGQLDTEVVAMYKEVVASKEKWLHRLFVCLCVLVLFILAVFLFDILNPSVGFFQR